ncbi:DUF1852 domain-containing protein [Sinorhizobium medicae]|uniref:DUF1852 domain-containing protein n=1 Tax=Sinorhizobium medicae TaxID=110321 RepID=UPI000FD892D6|nr:DUF1852 domain-containing protein [Sinorhizobium medicae]RVP47819.1 DUF1852 domain-containing protein [Sinorhizobium medicae]RVP74597.1 DUF1852 domain-containing protein [Sinorhizobium medicae]UWU12623.1 DUF1852 domain-containing protein [Sinorhizobium medicae]
MRAIQQTQSDPAFLLDAADDHAPEVKFHFVLKNIPFDENYLPAANTRMTTNFANLARGSGRQENLRNTLTMIDNRFNTLVSWDNPTRDRYSVALDIISVELVADAEGRSDAFPLIETLKTTIIDRSTDARIDGIVGHNLSSYVRDYDFSVVLPSYNKDRAEFSAPENFGELHGNLFKCFLNCEAFKTQFKKPPVICLSASTSKTYRRTDNQHPILGVEYQQDGFSATDEYFAKMGLKVRYFMPPQSVAPLAFYCAGDLLRDYTDLELISTISTMETFQRIYRPEIYNANSPAGRLYQPSLKHQDYSLTRIVYDRDERSRLAVEQGKFAEEYLIKPYGTILEHWSAKHAY